MKIAVLRDRIETLIVNWKADRIVNGVTVERFWQDLEDAEIIEDANAIGEPDSTTTENGVKKDTYIIKTTDGFDVEIIVTEDEKGDVNITVGKIESGSSTTPEISVTAPEISITEVTSTETSITVKVSVTELNSGKITYSYREQGTEEWTSFLTETTETTATVSTGITANKIYEVKAFAQNSGGNKEATQVISTDKTAPQDATATFDKTSVDTGEKVTATVTLKDDGLGVDLSKCKYIFKKSNTAITDESEFTKTFSNLTGTTTATGTIEFTPTEGGDWYLHVLTVDKAGNKKITAITNPKITAEEVFIYNETASIGTSYATYYADLNGDGKIDEENDGIIFADMVKDAGKTGDWNSRNNEEAAQNGYGVYTIKTVNSSNAKRYKVSSTDYTKGKFGPGKVLKVLDEDKNDTSKLDRFYVMTLKDFTTKTDGSPEKFYWYQELNYGKAKTDGISNDFGTGEANTKKIMGIWEKGEAGEFGSAQTTSGQYVDMWGVIGDKVAAGWFVPSRAEWAAFADAFGMEYSGEDKKFTKFGMSKLYATSSIYSEDYVWCMNFNLGYMDYISPCDNTQSVRLCRTF